MTPSGPLLLAATLLITPVLTTLGSPAGTVPIAPTDAYVAPEVPQVSAGSWLVYDVEAGIELAALAPDTRLPMASTTKLMTALLAIELGDLDDVVTVSYDAAIYRAPSGFGLAAGESWTLRDLLTALMVRSANDAAMAIGEHLGGSVDGFVALMNARAAELGLADTHFANPSGLDATGHYSTARDLATLALAALDHPLIARLARTKVVQFRDDPWGHERWGTNTNALLGAYPGVVGVKTGSTPNAKMVLVTLAERGGRRILTVVLGSDDSFADSRALLEFGFATFGPGERLLAPLVGVEGGGVATGYVSTDFRERSPYLTALPGAAVVVPDTGDEDETRVAIIRWLQGRFPFLFRSSP